MSLRELDQTFPQNSLKITDKNLAKIISNILRKKVSKKHGAVKYLSNLTGVDIHTLKKWYNGSSTPDLANFITLAHNIPEIVQIFLELCDKPEIWDIYQNCNHIFDISNNKAKIINCEESYSDKFSKTHVTINFSITKKLPNTLNERQTWFLQELHAGRNPKPMDIARVWNINLRTAKRDISLMKESQLIKFIGPRKYGKYYAI